MTFLWEFKYKILFTKHARKNTQGVFFMIAKIRSCMEILFVLALTLVCMASWAQPLPKEEKQVINMFYESWHNCSTGDTAIYRIKAEKGEPDVVEIEVIDRKLKSFKFQESYYRESKLFEEKRKTFSLEEIKRYYTPSELQEKGIEFSELRETFKGSVYSCQRYQYPDGSVEILCDKVPAGGLLKKWDKQGSLVQELLDMRRGKGASSMVSEIKAEVIKPQQINRTALTVSELMDDISREKKTQDKGRKKHSLVIGELGKQPEDVPVDAESFLEEVRLLKGKLTGKFNNFAPIFVMGFDGYEAKAKFHKITTRKPSREENPPIPKEITIDYSGYTPPEGESHGKALYTLLSEDKPSTGEVLLQVFPYPEMEVFELPPEAVTIIPGTFNCHHIRLVQLQPRQEVKKEGRFQTINMIDTKKDYWITNIKGYMAVAKRIDMKKEHRIKTPLDGVGESRSEIFVTEDKWTLVEFTPPSK